MQEKETWGLSPSEEIRLTTILGFRKSCNGCKMPSIQQKNSFLSNKIQKLRIYLTNARHQPHMLLQCPDKSGKIVWLNRWDSNRREEQLRAITSRLITSVISQIAQAPWGGRNERNEGREAYLPAPCPLGSDWRGGRKQSNRQLLCASAPVRGFASGTDSLTDW